MTKTGVPACTPTLQQINAAAWTYDNPPSDENDKVSVDHAYENGFLSGFMGGIIDNGTANGMNCATFNKQFFTTTGCADNRLEPIFGSLASYTNPDFVEMSQFLNGDAKGWVC